MLNLLKKPPPADTPTGPTPAEIAERAKRTAGHLLLEGRLDGLRDRREAIRLEVHAVRAAPSPGEQAREAKLKALHTEADQVENAIRDVRRQLQPHRQAHADKVERELGPLRTAAAKRVRAALAELHLSIGELNAANAAARRWGVDWPTVRLETAGLSHEIKHL